MCVCLVLCVSLSPLVERSLASAAISWPDLDQPKTRQAVLSVLCLLDNRWEGVKLRGQRDRATQGVCVSEKGRGVCVCCCPEDVLLLIQRPNLEQNTRAFCMHCCMCGGFVLSSLGVGCVRPLCPKWKTLSPVRNILKTIGWISTRE